MNLLAAHGIQWVTGRLRVPTAKDIANWFKGAIDRESGDSITHLKLQKLIYYAQAWSLALNDRCLFDEDLQAWAHGPVAESVYRDHEGSGWNALPPPEAMPTLDAADRDILEQVLQSYGSLSAKQLESMTHAELPWIEARGGLAPEARSTARISKQTMKRFYKRMYEDLGEEE